MITLAAPIGGGLAGFCKANDIPLDEPYIQEFLTYGPTAAGTVLGLGTGLSLGSFGFGIKSGTYNFCEKGTLAALGYGMGYTAGKFIKS